jgi:hypothetical protein
MIKILIMFGYALAAVGGWILATMWIKFVKWFTHDDQHLARISLMLAPVLIIIGFAVALTIQAP